MTSARAALLVGAAGIVLAAPLLGAAWLALPSEGLWSDENPLRVRVLGAAAAIASGPPWPPAPSGGASPVASPAG